MNTPLLVIESGTLSLILGITLIVLTVIGFIVLIKNSKNPAVDQPKFDKLVEISKWMLGTLLIGISATIISDGFKEREYDKNQMTTFNEYLKIVTDSGTIEKKWQLCQFFKAVSPKGDMRDSWERYETFLKNEISKVDSLNKKETYIAIAISQQDSITDTQKQSLKEIQKAKEAILSNLNASEPDNYIIIAGGDETVRLAQWELSKARKISSNTAIYKKGNMYRTVFTGFKNNMEAEAILGIVRQKLSRDSYIVKLKNWCKSVETTPDCLICN